MAATRIDDGMFDVAVVGGGIAGLVAATRAAEQGLKVLVLEKGREDRYLCNSRFTGGFFHVAMHDINSAPERLKAVIAGATRGYASEALAAALAEDAGRAVRWLRSQGVRLIKVGPEGYKSTVLAPPGLRQTGLHWQGRAGDVLLRTLGDRLAERGGTIARGTRAVRLIVQARVCTGVEVEGERAAQVRARAVVLADGGFQADAERVRQAISPRPERVLLRGAATGTGDGARMAAAVGAKLVESGTFYGHLQHVAALENDALWPYPILDTIASAGLVVDANGMRFCDESRGGVFIANAVAKLPAPDSATVVFDQAIWDGPGRAFLLPANPHLPKAGGEVIEAADVATLAGKLGLDAAALQETIDAYNGALAAGSPGSLTPPRHEGPNQPHPIRVPPYRAVRVCAGMTYTFGGIATDGHGRVLDTNDAAIEGLFAAGSTTGGLEGGPHAGYTGGLSKALVFGLRAAECIAGRRWT